MKKHIGETRWMNLSWNNNSSDSIQHFIEDYYCQQRRLNKSVDSVKHSKYTVVTTVIKNAFVFRSRNRSIDGAMSSALNVHVRS